MNDNEQFLQITVGTFGGVLFASSSADTLSTEAAAEDDEDEDEHDTKPLAVVTERHRPPTTWMKHPWPAKHQKKK